jgi:murein DD-endopeptidase MepM/ murein hydrolase activator NlpD
MAPQRPRPIVLLVAVLAIGMVLGALTTWALTGDEGGGGSDDDARPSGTAPTTTGSTEPAEAPTSAPSDAGRPSALALAEAIGPLAAPTDCPLRLDDPDLLPNAPRDYRGGVHEGVDLICNELGHEVVAPLPGRVLVAASPTAEPAPQERLDLLAEAKALGDTPPWTLQLLYGRFVVVDHGTIDGAGHVVTLYAHLDEVDPALRPGAEIAAGARIGTVGNTGTEAAGTGSGSPSSYHLHWEIHVDDEFLGRGAGPDDVQAAYRNLFGR